MEVTIPQNVQNGASRNDCSANANQSCANALQKDTTFTLLSKRKRRHLFLGLTHLLGTVSWEFWIGGYQPAQKWLKDRQGKILSYEELQHYPKIVHSLRETIRLMGEVDEVFCWESGEWLKGRG